MDVASDNPFEGLKIDSHDPLRKATKRTPCPECSASRKYFCYKCYIPMPEIAGKFQTVKLPLKVDIIKHKQEVDGKSTAPHAKILAPDLVTIYTYPTIPPYENKEKLLLVFPYKDAIALEQLMKHRTSANENSDAMKEQPQIHSNGIQEGNIIHCSQLEPSVTKPSSCSSVIRLDMDPQGSAYLQSSDQENAPHNCHQKCQRTFSETLGEGATGPDEAHHGAKVESEEGLFERVIFIDSTWAQSHAISIDERLAGIKRVILKDRETAFWRKQHRKPRTYLATIEAIYYFMVDYHTIILRKLYRGQYDNLLFFYSFMYHLVKKAAKEEESQEEIHPVGFS
ncbi:DTW domain-containing protein 1-like [Acanthaster planci]|uniref:tRNA-uridine aminocarboxypropyltransferase 1 n=1 Tax=Acanthaster planci TaxID=133434 RepID=A0A8B7ZZX1_ACAPL|nr:DTW domain-containing protein 1-like [Acanthaster planci]XP_022110279.1 DTW domain-containing protein 1-like [Acanthaster planci]XP_022110280.1 DTW domain-containing protein 1-like [Acanthaster planci]XP_022110281.1 DTW domain-containing protein 1-like [Acanthaster planci]XP_022110283.1 DTW domain-containing protein 1-like [Acanthaster planci]XP_022110284.1 DTW domain-containing protein 1-like [Acanthaster planci]XP_022110285.1 DTW domain-containing protein 1-like [Acanthaster planci]XP_0